MDWPGLRRRDGGRFSSGIAEYGSLYVLLVAFTFAGVVVGRVVRSLADSTLYYLSPRSFGAVVYSVLGVAVLGLGYLAFAQGRDGVRLDAGERGRIALALWLLLLVGFYAALGPAGPSGSATSLLGTVLSSVGVAGLLAVLYLRLYGAELRLDAPDRSETAMLWAAVLVPVLVVVVLSIATLLGLAPPRSLIFDVRYRPPSLSGFGTVVVESLFVAFGTALLFHGAIQETIRDSETPPGGIVCVTVLVGLYRGGPWAVLVGSSTLVSGVVALALVVVSTALVVRLWRALDLSVSNSSETTIAGAFGVAVVAVVVGTGYSVFGYPAVVGHVLGHAATVGVAAVAYERTRSVWVPTLALVTFSVAFDLAASLLALSA